MKKRGLALILALVMCLTLGVPVFAAEADLPDWNFLFAIFKNVDADCTNDKGIREHAKYTMAQDEIDYIRKTARDFEEYMSQVGVMRAYVEVLEVDTTVTELGESVYGSWISVEEAAVLLNGKADLDNYDHVFCVTSLNVPTAYMGLTGDSFENGTGHSCINFLNRKYLDFLKTSESVKIKFSECVSTYVHEFLHFMEQMDEKWGTGYDLHDIRINFYGLKAEDNGKECYTDIILNRAKGNAGIGVLPAAWQCPPQVLRTMREWTVSSEVTSIGTWAFENSTALTKIFIPDSLTSIGYAAFWNTALTDVYYSGSRTQWQKIQIDEFNNALTDATIYYNVYKPSTLPTAENLAKDNWTATDAVSFKHVENDGSASTGVRYIVTGDGVGLRYIFHNDGTVVANQNTAAPDSSFVVTDEGQVLTDGNLYYLNPARDINDPRTCYVMTDYLQVRDNYAGQTYYDEDGITFQGWMKTPDGGLRYQTCIPQPDKATNLYLIVWRVQDLPACQHPDHPGDPAYFLPAGRYFFDDDGVLVQKEGWNDGKDGKEYYTNANGLVVQERAK